MKRRHLLLTLMVLFSNVILGQYDIKIEVDGFNCKDELRLAYYVGDKSYFVKSSICENGIFHIKGEKNLSTGNYVILLPNNGFFDIMVSSSEDQMKYSFQVDSSLYIDEMKTSGSRENELFFAFRKFETIQNSKIEYEKQLLESSTDELKKQLSLNKIKSIEESIEKNRREIIAKSGNLFVGKFLKAHIQVPMVETPKGLNGKSEEMYKYAWIHNHYFDNIDLKEDGLIRTQIYQKEIARYFEKHLPRDVDSSIIVVDKFLSRLVSEGSNAQFMFCLAYLTNHFQSSKKMCFDKIAWHLAQNYYCAGKANLDENRRKQACKFAASQLSGLCGEQAHDMNMPDTSFVDRKRLYDIDKACTVVVFWDIDCSHCKHELPIIQSMYDTLNQDELEIYAVYIKKDFERWREDVKKSNFTFTHVANVNGDSDFNDFYKIVSTPKIYVLDRDKNIVFKDIQITDIPSMLNYMISKEKAEN